MTLGDPPKINFAAPKETAGGKALNYPRYNGSMSSSIASSPVEIRCQGVLFDMDGILISSLGSVERSWTKWAEMRGVDPVYACQIAHGCRSIETVARLQARPGRRAREQNHRRAWRWRTPMGSRCCPACWSCSAALPRDRWTVVTSATEPLARVRLAAGGIPVPERIVTAECVTEGKPFPRLTWPARRCWVLRPEECVVFEDAASGASRAGPPVARWWPLPFRTPRNRLMRAEYLVPDLDGCGSGNPSPAMRGWRCASRPLAG